MWLRTIKLGNLLTSSATAVYTNWDYWTLILPKTLTGGATIRSINSLDVDNAIVFAGSLDLSAAFDDLGTILGGSFTSNMSKMVVDDSNIYFIIKGRYTADNIIQGAIWDYINTNGFSIILESTTEILLSTAEELSMQLAGFNLVASGGDVDCANVQYSSYASSTNSSGLINIDTNS